METLCGNSTDVRVTDLGAIRAWLGDPVRPDSVAPVAVTRTGVSGSLRPWMEFPLTERIP